MASEALHEHIARVGLDPSLIDQYDGPPAKLISTLWKTKGLDRALLTQALAAYFQIPVAPTLETDLDSDQLDRAPIGYLRANQVIPLKIRGDVLHVALSDPQNTAVLNDLKNLFDAPRLRLGLAEPDAVLEAVNRLHDKSTGPTREAIQELDGEAADFDLTGLKETTDLLDDRADAPVVKLVNLILVEAVKNRASDIHIEPYGDSLNVRYRVDGLLHDVHSPPRGLAAAISSRIKVMSNLDIAERRLPQDGRFEIKVANQRIDVRVSVVPTAFGERIVLRLLNKGQALKTLPEIGMDAQTLEQIDRLIHRTSGIVLVTGPTGSGKTTTLYAALSAINSSEKNILTVEDPIEYQIAGVGQMQMNSKIDLTFARALRSILRHDPDVIMIGEIRDAETAQIAIHASQTGHLVFSTLHTNDSAGAITRLIDMGVEPFLIASSVAAVLAQRLIRRICPHCKAEHDYPPQLLAQLGLKPEDGPFWKGTGCPACLETGYLGRAGIFELLIVDEPIRELIVGRATAGAIAARARETGLRPMPVDGAARVVAGETTPEEVVRVVHT